MMGGGPADEDDRTTGSGRVPLPSAGSVAAVIVTFHPDPALGERVRPLVGQVGAIVVVDNGSSDAELSPVDALVRAGVVETIRNGRNLGVAVALNQGLAWAKERGYAWALTLDQDTEPGPGVVAEAARVVEAYGDRRIAVVGAGYAGARTVAGSPTIGAEVVWVITSGGMHSIPAWRDLGGFREDFFIDYVDIEFCLRARAGGYLVVQSLARTMVHSIGRPTRRWLLVRWVSPTHHDRGRRYFITRNRIVVWRRYWRHERRWVATDVAGVVKDYIKIVLFEEDRAGKLRAIARGVLDGIRASALDDRTTGSGRVSLPSAGSVAAVIVTFHPDPALGERVRPLVGQVGAIVVVDNGSSDAELSPVDALVRAGVVETIRNGRNLGVAVALNQGLAWAKERGYAWALTLDQDTEPGPGVVAEAARVVEAYGDRRIAVVGAGYAGARLDQAFPLAVARDQAEVITSGGMHSIPAWRDLGGFREDFFIDYVDTEFCLRARANGYAVLRSGRATMKHAIGAPTTHGMVFRTVTPTNHSRRRRYYITRNRITVWRMYAHREPRYVARDVTAAAKELVKLVLFEDDRSAKLRAVAHGAWDGIRGATGRANDA